MGRCAVLLVPGLADPQILAARPAMARAITCVSGAVMIVIGLLLLAGRLII
jgi:hypothetical protein